MTVNDYIKKLEGVTIEVQEAGLLKIIDRHKDRLIDLNLSQLNNFGIGSDGQKLEPYRSESYAAFKLELNPAGVVDYKLTGSFQRGFFAQDSAFPVTVFSSDSKTAMLLNRDAYIFNLTEKNKTEFVHEDLKSDVIELYKKFLLAVR